MKYRTTESYPGQHRELAAKELVGKLIDGPMIFDDIVRERAWCQEEAVKIIAAALLEWEEEKPSHETSSVKKEAV